MNLFTFNFKKNHEIIKLFFKIIIFILILFFLDNTISFILQFFRPNYYKTFIDTKKEFFKENELYDIIFIGDSHIADAVNPEIIYNKSRKTSFNLGIYHTAPYESYFIVKSILKHQKKKPEIIVLGTNPEMFEKGFIAHNYTVIIINDFFINTQLYFFSNDKFTIEYFSKTIKEKYLFETMFKRLVGKINESEPEIIGVYNGYLKKTNYSSKEFLNKVNPPSKRSLKQKQVEYFIKIIELLQKNNIQVIIINPPIWKKQFENIINSKSFKDFESTINIISKKYDILVYDYNRLKNIDKLMYSDFGNVSHLNLNGANKYTNDLTEWMKNHKIINYNKKRKNANTCK